MHASLCLRRSLFAFVVIANAALAAPLAGTSDLTWDGDLAARMVDGIHTFLDRATAASVERRARHWKRDYSSAEAYTKSVEPNRQRLKQVLGVVDERLPELAAYQREVGAF
ncbi:MAG TPA: hypothetical protein VG713_06030, partial [Pirellulales bacterium]|nr:hypothetical protein [Pirellulales bacterium]